MKHSKMGKDRSSKIYVGICMYLYVCDYVCTFYS